MASPTISSSSLPTPIGEDTDEERFIMAQLKHEMGMAMNQSDDLLDEWYGRKVLPPIPEDDGEDEIESSAPQNLLEEVEGADSILKDRTTENEGPECDQMGSVAAVAAAATGEVEMKDLPEVPSTIENSVSIKPLDGKKDVSLQEIEEFHVEPFDETYDVPLYDSFGFFAESILDLVPLDPAITPYSWMSKNHGKNPEAVQSPIQKEWCNIEGEKEVEVAIKTFVTRPQAYFLIATCAKCLVRFRHDKLISEQACASLLFRCVNADARLWDPIKKAFISKDFDVVRFPKLCLEHQSLNQAVTDLYDSVKKIHTMRFTKTLKRLIEALLANHHADCFLVHKKTGKAVANDQKQRDGLDISEDFMGRFGCPWPFQQLTPAQADVYGVGEPLAFEEVFGNAEYLARERAILNNKAAVKQGKKAKKRSRWQYPVEEASEYLNDLYEQMKA